MIEWVVKVAFLSLVFAAMVGLQRLQLKDDQVKGRLFNALLIIITVLIMVIYVREIVLDHIIPAPSDEANYVQILTDVDAGKEPVISGPGYVIALMVLYNLTGLNFASLSSYVGIIVAITLVAIIYRTYRKRLGPTWSISSIVLLLSTSYFLWPMIEGRPQQVGMGLVFGGVILYHRYLENKEFPLALSVVLVIIFFYHILSLLVLSGMIFIIWWYWFCMKRTTIKSLVLPAVLNILFVAMFMSNDLLYDQMNGGVEWMVQTSSMGPIANWTLLLILIPITMALIVPVTWAVGKYELLPKLFSLARSHAKVFIIGIGVLAGLAFILQFFLISDIYSAKYHDNFGYFIIMSLGNIGFGAAFLYGSYLFITQHRKESPFFTACIALMVLGVLVIGASLVLPEGFNNWLIRTVNYWTMFAAPIGGIALLRSSTRAPWLQRYILPALAVLSLINISRDPDLFGYP